MKKILILFIVLTINQMVIAQTNFFKTYKQPSHERAFASVQTEDGGYIIVGEKRVSGYNGNNQGYFAKLSGNGEITNEVLFDPLDASRYCITFPYEYGTASFLCIGASDSIVGIDTYSRLIFKGIDDELNVVESEKWPYTLIAHLYPWQYCITSDSIMYLQYDYYVNNENHIGVNKYQMPFDLQASYLYGNYSVTQDLLFKEPCRQLQVFDYASKTSVLLDENLNFISSKRYSQKFMSNIALTKINDTNYLLTGGASFMPSLNNKLGCIRYNNDDISLDSIFYTPSTDTVFYSGGRENTVIIGNNIYIAGFYNVNAMWFPYNSNPSWVTVTKLDMDLNMISTHFYGGDAQYCPFSIIATSDSGCFVTGYSYDYINNLPTNNLELDIFALKVDSDGLITDLPDQPEAKAHDAIIYPNPGIDYLKIQSGPQITGAEFHMFDMQGRQVLNEKINNTQLKVNTANLAPGTYPWQIIFKNKVIESGKWVKK